MFPVFRRSLSSTQHKPRILHSTSQFASSSPSSAAHCPSDRSPRLALLGGTSGTIHGRRLGPSESGSLRAAGLGLGSGCQRTRTQGTGRTVTPGRPARWGRPRARAAGACSGHSGSRSRAADTAEHWQGRRLTTVPDSGRATCLSNLTCQRPGLGSGSWALQVASASSHDAHGAQRPPLAGNPRQRGRGPRWGTT
jgi:hypothetical protein